MDTKEFVQDSVGRSLTEYKTKYPPVPAEGFDGQVLMKNSDESGDFIWKSMMGSGWGVAKVGTASISFNSSGGTSSPTTINISNLGIENVNDYTLLYMVKGGTGAWGQAVLYITSKTVNSVTLGGYGDGGYRSDFDYVILAKGYGGGSGSGGTAMQHRVVGQEELIGDWTENGVTYDLYRKIIDCGALPDTTSKTVAHGITNKEKIISISGVAVGSSNNLTIPFAALENQYNIYVGVGPANITLTTGNDRSGYNAHITIEFTRARA